MQIGACAVPLGRHHQSNVTVRVDAVVYFRVVDPIKATINVQNYMFAISQQAQTSLRSIVGQSECTSCRPSGLGEPGAAPDFDVAARGPGA